MMDYIVSILNFIILIPVLVYDKFIEIIYCYNIGHKFELVRDIKFSKDKNIRWNGVKIVKCKNCHRTKLIWY